MILPATVQILLHSSVLIWTGYSLIVDPSRVLDSSIVGIFGEAMQLVCLLLRLAKCKPRFSASQFGDHGLSYAGIMLLYLALVDLIPLFRKDWTYYQATSILKMFLEAHRSACESYPDVHSSWCCVLE